MQPEGEAKLTGQPQQKEIIPHSISGTQRQQQKGRMEVPAAVDAKNVNPAHDHGMSFAGGVKN